jgi:hypothetical protein
MATLGKREKIDIKPTKEGRGAVNPERENTEMTQVEVSTAGLNRQLLGPMPPLDISCLAMSRARPV